MAIAEDHRRPPGRQVKGALPMHEWLLPADNATDPAAGGEKDGGAAERLYRRIQGSIAGGVAVITALDVDGVPVGITTGTLGPVSRSPAVILACIPYNAFAAGAIRRSGAFAVNVLGAADEPLARRFSVRSARFDGIATSGGRLGIPLLVGGLAVAECNLIGLQRIGDQLVMFGRIMGGSARDAERPLLRVHGGYVAMPSGHADDAEESA